MDGIVGPMSTFLHSVALLLATTEHSLSSLTSSLQPFKLSLLVLSVTSRTSSLNPKVSFPTSGGVSPLVSSSLTLPGLLVELAPCCSHFATHSSYCLPIGGTLAVVLSLVPVLAALPAGPSSVASRTSKKCPINNVEIATHPLRKQ